MDNVVVIVEGNNVKLKGIIYVEEREKVKNMHNK